MRISAAFTVLFAMPALLWLLPSMVEAQSEGADSTKPYRMDEMIVTSTRILSSIERSPMKTSLLTREMFARGNGVTLGDALKHAPGLVVREYGGGGGIQTLSFRGMSSEQTLVLIDGVPSNTLQTGVIDLRMLPLQGVEAIEVVRGGMGSMYGSNAMGGMINLRTDPSSRTPYFRFGASAGSFGFSTLSASARFLASGAVLSAGMARERSSGRYPVRFLAAGTILEGIRANSDYRSDHLFLRSDFPPTEVAQGALTLSATWLDRGSPGPLVALSSQGDGRQSDAAYLMTGSYERRLSSTTSFSLSGSAQRSDERYRDETGLFRGENSYRNAVLTASPLLHYAASQKFTLTSGWDLDQAFADGNALPGSVRRSHAAWFAAAELRSDTLEALRASFAVLPAMRLEAFSSTQPLAHPQVGLLARFDFGRWRMRAHSSFGKGFRVPTMNELYYSGGGGYGNPGLKPEESFNADAGTTIFLDFFGNMECDVTYYSIVTRERIFWQPASSPFIWSPVNIAETISRGFELEGVWTSPSGAAEVRGSYCFVDARNRSGRAGLNPVYDKQLAYIPLETGSLSLQLQIPVMDGTIRRLFLRAEDQYLGQRYTSDDNSLFLPAVHILGGNIGLALDLFEGTMSLKYELDNISDRDIQGMPGYPAPLRHHALSVTFEKHLEKEP